MEDESSCSFQDDKIIELSRGIYVCRYLKKKAPQSIGRTWATGPGLIQHGRVHCFDYLRCADSLSEGKRLADEREDREEEEDNKRWLQEHIHEMTIMPGLRPLAESPVLGWDHILKTSIRTQDSRHCLPTIRRRGIDSKTSEVNISHCSSTGTGQKGWNMMAKRMGREAGFRKALVRISIRTC